MKRTVQEETVNTKTKMEKITQRPKVNTQVTNMENQTAHG